MSRLKPASWSSNIQRHYYIINDSQLGTFLVLIKPSSLSARTPPTPPQKPNTSFSIIHFIPLKILFFSNCTLECKDSPSVISLKMLNLVIFNPTSAQPLLNWNLGSTNEKTKQNRQTKAKLKIKRDRPLCFGECWWTMRMQVKDEQAGGSRETARAASGCCCSWGGGIRYQLNNLWPRGRERACLCVCARACTITQINFLHGTTLPHRTLDQGGLAVVPGRRPNSSVAPRY